MPPEDGMAAAERLLGPAFGMYRVECPGSPGVEFHLSYGDWIRLLRRSGFEVEDLIEVTAFPALHALVVPAFTWQRIFRQNCGKRIAGFDRIR
jgi:hypothetical protein